MSGRMWARKMMDLTRIWKEVLPTKESRRGGQALRTFREGTGAGGHGGSQTEGGRAPPIRTLEGAEGRGRGGQGRGHRLPHREPGFLRRPWAVALGKAEPSPAPHRMPVETEFVYPHSGAGSEGSMTCSDLRCLFNRRAQPWEEHKTQHHPE